MSDSQERPWSNNPNAPKVPHDFYLEEKAYFAGVLIAAILYGTRKIPPQTRLSAMLNLFARPSFHRGHRHAVFPMYGRVV